MVDPVDLEVRLLVFRGKSFQFLRRVEGPTSEPWLLFHRRETESEAKLRPRLIDLYVLVPDGVLHAGADGETLEVGSGGRTLFVRPASREAAEFEEGRIRFRAEALPGGGLLYAPQEGGSFWRGPDGRRSLGLAGDDGGATGSPSR